MLRIVVTRLNGVTAPVRVSVGWLAAVSVLSVCLTWASVPSLARAAETSIDELTHEYHELAKKAVPLVAAIRENRRQGDLTHRDDVLLIRKGLSDIIKALRRYHQRHALAERRKDEPYEDRADVLALLRAADELNKWLDGEIRANDWLLLTEKYEENWKRADAEIHGEKGRSAESAP